MLCCMRLPYPWPCGTEGIGKFVTQESTQADMTQGSPMCQNATVIEMFHRETHKGLTYHCPNPVPTAGSLGLTSVEAHSKWNMFHMCPCVFTYVHCKVWECAPGFRGCTGSWKVHVTCSKIIQSGEEQASGLLHPLPVRLW